MAYTIDTTINVSINYVEFAAIVLGRESKKIQEKNLWKNKKDGIFFTYCIILTLRMTFVKLTNIQQLLYVPSVM